MIESEGRIYNSNEFHVWKNKNRQIQSLQLNLAGTVTSSQQYFITTSFLDGRYSDSIGSGSSQHLSDTQMGYTFEVIPEYSFSYLRPVVYLSLLANLPTGKSIYDDSSLSEGTDVTGHNQWGLGMGLTARKVYFPLTLTLQARSLRMFAKTFNQLNVSDFYDSSIALLFNYATRFKDVSLNLGLTAYHLSKRSIGTGAESGVMQNLTVILGLQKPLNESWNVGLNYSDQTLVGPAKNSILNRTITLNVNYNYF
jgi:hypothetical protein